MICINCDYEHNGNFCSNCGEKANVPTITFSSILKDAFAKITNMDKGFFFNVKSLLLNPNKIITDYILGKRKNIFNPISFLLISITIYLIANSFITPSEKSAIDSKAYSYGLEAGRFMKYYSKYFWILSIIWLSFATKLVFQKYNYAEHLTINSFIIGQATLIGLITKFRFHTLLLNPIIYMVIIWMIFQMFKVEDHKYTSLFLSILTTILFFIQLVVIILLIVVAKVNLNW